MPPLMLPPPLKLRGTTPAMLRPLFQPARPPRRPPAEMPSEEEVLDLVAQERGPGLMEDIGQLFDAPGMTARNVIAALSGSKEAWESLSDVARGWLAAVHMGPLGWLLKAAGVRDPRLSMRGQAAGKWQLEEWGMPEHELFKAPVIGKVTGRGVAGFGYEVLTDPLNWLLPGVGGLTKKGHAALRASKTGKLAGTLAEQAAAGLRGLITVHGRAAVKGEGLFKLLGRIGEKAAKTGTGQDLIRMFGKARGLPGAAQEAATTARRAMSGAQQEVFERASKMARLAEGKRIGGLFEPASHVFPGLDDVVTAADKRFLRAPLDAFKFGKDDRWAAGFADAIARGLDEAGVALKEFDAIVPVPARPGATWKRIERMAQELSERTGLPVEDLLGWQTGRAGAHQAQTKFRKAGMRGAFFAHEGASGRRFLVVDDRITTGGTITDAARALREKGARGVSAAAVARGHYAAQASRSVRAAANAARELIPEAGEQVSELQNAILKMHLEDAESPIERMLIEMGIEAHKLAHGPKGMRPGAIRLAGDVADDFGRAVFDAAEKPAEAAGWLVGYAEREALGPTAEVAAAAGVKASRRHETFRMGRAMVEEFQGQIKKEQGVGLATRELVMPRGGNYMPHVVSKEGIRGLGKANPRQLARFHRTLMHKYGSVTKLAGTAAGAPPATFLWQGKTLTAKQFRKLIGKAEYSWYARKGLLGELHEAFEEISTWHRSMLPRKDVWRHVPATDLNALSKRMLGFEIFQTDPGVAYAVRGLWHHKVMAGAQMMHGLGDEFGRLVDADDLAKGVSREGLTELPNGWLAIDELNQMRGRMGQKAVAFEPELAREAASQYARLLDPERGGAFLRMYDKLLGQWKGWSTVVWPGFHVRNALDDTWRAWIGGLSDPRPYKWSFDVMAGRAGELVTKTGEVIGYDDLKRLFDRSGVAWQGHFGVEVPGQVGRHLKKIKSVPARAWKALKLLDPRIGENPGLEMLARMGNKRENLQRLSIFTDQLWKGATPEAAAAWVRRVAYDYGDLTKFEKGAKRFIPFYAWLRKNTPFQLREIMQQPAKYALTMRAVQRGLGEPPDAEEASVLPLWLRQGLNVRLGEDRQGHSMYLASIGLSLEDIGRLFVWEDGLGGMARRWLSNLTPILKFPLEKAAGKDFFFDTRIAGYDKAYGALKHLEKIPGGSRVLEMIGFKEYEGRDGFKRFRANPHVIHALNQFRAYREVGKLTDERKNIAARMLAFLSGWRHMSVDLEQRKKYAVREWLEKELREAELAGEARPFMRYYTPRGREISSETEGLVRMQGKY